MTQASQPGESAKEVLMEAARLVRFQAELGLSSLEVEDSLFEFPPVLEVSSRSSASIPATPSTPSGASTRVSSADSAKSNPERKGKFVAGMEFTGTLLDNIIEEIGDCQRCGLHQRRSNIVFGVGSPSARLMFVGEGPGRDEDLCGEPFVGEAGHLLDRMISAMGLSRGEVYIANIVKCRPPRNRDPEPEEVEQCETFLRKQIEIIQPEVLVALGRYAAQTLLRDSTPITGMRGNWREYEGIPLMPTFHPADLLRNPTGKKPVWADLQEVMKRLGLTGARE